MLVPDCSFYSWGNCVCLSPVHHWRQSVASTHSLLLTNAFSNRVNSISTRSVLLLVIMYGNELCRSIVLRGPGGGGGVLGLGLGILSSWGRIWDAVTGPLLLSISEMVATGYMYDTFVVKQRFVFYWLTDICAWIRHAMLFSTRTRTGNLLIRLAN